MKRINFSILGLILGIIIYLINLISGFDLFEKSLAMIMKMEMFEIDEFIIPLLIFILFTIIQLVKNDKTNTVTNEKLNIYKAMVSSSHHIINNFLNQIQLIKITAEEFPDFDPEVLELYEKTVNETKKQIESLSNLTQIDVETIYNSVAPKKDI